MRFMCFDVESIGLHGEGFAVGWTIVQDDTEIRHGYAACPQDAARGTDEDREWVVKNVTVPGYTHDSPQQVRQAFWQAWEPEQARKTDLWSEVNWPVETGFLSACVADDMEARRWKGPYPLYDIGMIRRLILRLAGTGLVPADLKLLDNVQGQPHNPLYDARMSARVIVDFYRRHNDLFRRLP